MDYSSIFLVYIFNNIRFARRLSRKLMFEFIYEMVSPEFSGKVLHRSKYVWLPHDWVISMKNEINSTRNTRKSPRCGSDTVLRGLIRNKYAESWIFFSVPSLIGSRK